MAVPAGRITEDKVEVVVKVAGVQMQATINPRNNSSRSSHLDTITAQEAHRTCRVLILVGGTQERRVEVLEEWEEEVVMRAMTGHGRKMPGQGDRRVAVDMKDRIRREEGK